MILFCGGGTLGPVTPLIAVLRRMRKMRPHLRFAWAGTPNGPERELIEREGVTFHPIPSAKFTRYPSIRWLTWPAEYLRARRAADVLIQSVRPNLVVGAGGFTQVPVMRAASKHSIPCAIHQLDARPGLSNRQVASLCSTVTTSFAYEDPPFGSRVRAEQIPTPCRFAGVTVPDREAAADRFFLDPHRPILFILGGGTGALTLNQAVAANLDAFLEETQIIHSTGKGKHEGLKERKGYVVREFLDERDTLFAYAAADAVVCRAGMGTLTEVAALSKAAIVVPIPGSHQEENVSALNDGALSVKQSDTFGADLFDSASAFLSDASQRTRLGSKIHEMLTTDSGAALAEKWLKLLHSGNAT